MNSNIQYIPILFDYELLLCHSIKEIQKKKKNKIKIKNPENPENIESR